MESAPEPARRRPPRPWLAALLALVDTSLGHAYAGRTTHGIVVAAIGFALAGLVVLGMRAGPASLVAALFMLVAF